MASIGIEGPVGPQVLGAKPVSVSTTKATDTTSPPISIAPANNEIHIVVAIAAISAIANDVVSPVSSFSFLSKIHVGVTPSIHFTFFVVVRRLHELK